MPWTLTRTWTSSSRCRDPGRSSPRARHSSIWSTSALIVAFPVFLYLSHRTPRLVSVDPARRTSAVRRWLTHLTLALAAVVVLGDVIALVYGFLSGEVTVRFILKVAIVALIAGSIFAYYFAAVKADDAALAR